MARCASHAGEFNAGRVAWEEILATCRVTGSAEGELEAHNQLAKFSQLLGDHAAAISSLRKAAELSQQTGPASSNCSPAACAGRLFSFPHSTSGWDRRIGAGPQASEKVKHLGLLSEIYALEGYALAKSLML